MCDGVILFLRMVLYTKALQFNKESTKIYYHLNNQKEKPYSIKIKIHKMEVLKQGGNVVIVYAFVIAIASAIIDEFSFWITLLEMP